MAHYFFHCSDGADLVLDRAGRDLDENRDVSNAATEAAEALISRLPAYDEWENWSVYVYDSSGQVSVVPFPSRRHRIAA